MHTSSFRILRWSAIFMAAFLYPVVAFALVPALKPVKAIELQPPHVQPVKAIELKAIAAVEAPYATEAVKFAALEQPRSYREEPPARIPDVPVIAAEPAPAVQIVYHKGMKAADFDPQMY